MGSVSCSTAFLGKFSEPGAYWKGSSCDNSMCEIDDKDNLEFNASVKFSSVLVSADLNKVIICSWKSPFLSDVYNQLKLNCLIIYLHQSFNPMCEPTEDWPSKLDQSSELSRSGVNLSLDETMEAASTPGMSGKENGFTFLCGPPAGDEDEEVTESKIRAFLDEKVWFVFQIQ